MAIDFGDPVNRLSYSGRQADTSWRDAVTRLVDPAGRDVVDLGCGGGTYTRAWLELGAASVVGVDSSAPILGAAREAHGELPGARFLLADAAATGLPAAAADVVFSRALIHHLPSPAGVAREARRLLRPGGVCLLQDRTPADVRRPGSPQHVRGWFFEIAPRLLAVELGRRPADDAVRTALRDAGFRDVVGVELWETRRAYADREDFLADIGDRTGRSILHELTDVELAGLVRGLRDRLPAGPVVERDCWTLWAATA